jgi:hypothetical protein
MKVMILGAMALCFAAPTVASAEAVVVTTNRHHHRHYEHDANVKIINEDGHRLHHRKHGTVAFYDHGRRHHRADTVIVTKSARPLHRHRHVVIQDDNEY